MLLEDSWHSPSLGNRAADKHCIDSTITQFQASSHVLWCSCYVQPDLLGTWSETPKTGFLMAVLKSYLVCSPMTAA